MALEEYRTALHYIASTAICQREIEIGQVQFIQGFAFNYEKEVDILNKKWGKCTCPKCIATKALEGSDVKEFCYITKKNNGIIVDCSYNSAFVQDIKKVPPQDRKWSADTQQWWVADKYARQIEIYARSHFEQVLEA